MSSSAKSAIAVVFFTLLFAKSSLAIAQENNLFTSAMAFFWAQDLEQSSTQSLRPLGSGFLVSKDGYVITAKHVLETTVAGERVAVSVGGKSSPPVVIDKSEIWCGEIRDVCVTRVPPDSVSNVENLFQLECTRAGPGMQLKALGFIGGADRFGGVNTFWGSDRASSHWRFDSHDFGHCQYNERWASNKY